ncbi:MAG: hypothetical protein J5781_03555 [Clostridia bacterium]|nr:hypothetical protein [Clostridia bacterium]
MIHETVDAILAAEDKVAKEIAQATEDAKESVQQAEKEAERIRTEVVVRMKAERKKTAEAAMADGEKQYTQILASGKQNAQRLLSSTDLTPAVEYIKEKVTATYVHC